MHDGDPPLGFHLLVAPTSKNASPWNTGHCGETIQGHVFELFRRAHASAQMAPSLCDFAREILEAKQVSPEGIDSFLKSLGNVSRYDRAFRAFYQFCGLQKTREQDATISEMAGLLLLVHGCNKNQARNAYSGQVLLRGSEQLKYSPLIKKVHASVE